MNYLCVYFWQDPVQCITGISEKPRGGPCGEQLQVAQAIEVHKWGFGVQLSDILPKTNMTMEDPPFEDVFPIEHADVPMSS